jgi:hypothetical protein
MALGFDYSSSGPRLDDRAREKLRVMAEQIVQSFLGEEPNCRLSTRRELRWGSKGSVKLVVEGDKQGLWKDHENDVGGVKQQRGCSIMFAPNRRCEEHKRSGVRVNRRKKHASRSRLARRRPARRNIFSLDSDEAVLVPRGIRWRRQALVHKKYDRPS